MNICCCYVSYLQIYKLYKSVIVYIRQQKDQEIDLQKFNKEIEKVKTTVHEKELEVWIILLRLWFSGVFCLF